MPFPTTDDLINFTKAETKTYRKGDIVFSEGETSAFFLFLKEGELSVFNFTEEGKSFLQHKVIEGNLFGEPAVLLEKPFPGNMEVTSVKAVVMKIRREALIQYMLSFPEVMLDFTRSVAEKSIKKSQNLRNIVFQNPEDRIIYQLTDFKKEHCPNNERIRVDLTRKELSNLTGLRIETVIRTVKKMEKDGKLDIVGGKIYF